MPIKELISSVLANQHQVLEGWNISLTLLNPEGYCYSKRSELSNKLSLRKTSAHPTESGLLNMFIYMFT